MKLHRKTSFGQMAVFELPHGLLGSFELMHFESSGKPHKHPTTEIAVCVGGVGTVHVGTGAVFVKPGRFVTIPAGVMHHMEPITVGGPLTMMILYAS